MADAQCPRADGQLAARIAALRGQGDVLKRRERPTPDYARRAVGAGRRLRGAVSLAADARRSAGVA
jgi:hypothetical protein